jgi:glycosyl transferase family 25
MQTYDRVRIVNLATRADRRREISDELRRIGLAGDSKVSFFPAVSPDVPDPWRSRGERGCYLSHLSILKEANAAGQSVLILEDDCDFTDAAFDSDWGRGSDIFYGGFGASDYANLHTSMVQGSHCMGFSAAVLPSLVAFLEHHSDVHFRKAHPEVNVAFALPQVAVQRQSPSDIAVGRFDRSPVLAFLARIVRKLNRSRYRRLKMMEGL